MEKSKKLNSTNKLTSIALKLYKNDIFFAVMVALLITVLTFSVFMGQALFSDVMTLGKNGDTFQMGLSHFLKILDYPILSGVDVGTQNGATEFFLRPNLPSMYLPVILFAYLMSTEQMPIFSSKPSMPMSCAKTSKLRTEPS